MQLGLLWQTYHSRGQECQLCGFLVGHGAHQIFKASKQIYIYIYIYQLNPALDYNTYRYWKPSAHQTFKASKHIVVLSIWCLGSWSADYILYLEHLNAVVIMWICCAGCWGTENINYSKHPNISVIISIWSSVCWSTDYVIYLKHPDLFSIMWFESWVLFGGQIT